MRYKGVIETFREYLPVTDKTPVITFFEGNTPLIFSKDLSDTVKCQVYLKFEGANPTGSFKDRGMTMAISKAAEQNKKAVICASTGNTSASAAAYAAKAGMDCIVIIPEGKIALGKLAQALIHGAKVFAVNGNFDQALELVRELGDKYPIEIVNSINPYRIEGQKTGAFEICEQLEAVPDYHFIPVGNAGNITAYWKGYKEFYSNKKISKLPKMMGFQAAGSAPIVLNKKIDKPETIATAIRIGNPASWKSAVLAKEESNGIIDMVSDEEIIEAYNQIASKTGVFCEPASAASVAGLLKCAKEGKIKGGSLVVGCLRIDRPRPKRP
ncbi:MAG: threonine synthase [Candidatus Saganbacteria bacterium]|uniref:Threonine synthase n=1 Tax=Candidatus Saganbacteria bacterium TaxID=2575572 RepID=A0A833NXY0_UNCSA|nr:MAG: threonine synthase [Candidatus Saganbacteria bacterium]